MIKIEYCKNCGQEIIFDTLVCPNCQQPLINTIKDSLDNSVKTGIFGIVLSIIPILGWIIGYRGLKKANLYNNKTGRLLNTISIFLGFISFFVNIYLYYKGYLNI